MAPRWPLGIRPKTRGLGMRCRDGAELSFLILMTLFDTSMSVHEEQTPYEPLLYCRKDNEHCSTFDLLILDFFDLGDRSVPHSELCRSVFGSY